MSVYRGASEVFRLRTSRKYRGCDYSRDSSWFRACCAIAPGQHYVHVTVFPGHDFIETSKPIAGACCLTCAAGYRGMDELVGACPACLHPRDSAEHHADCVAPLDQVAGGEG